MDKQTFEQFQNLIRSASGIALTEEKIPLLVNRINKRLRALKLDDPKDYLKVLKADDTGNELVNLIDVVSTNVTFFYREKEHFEVLKDLLKKNGGKSDKVRIWCAASSSGEEPYTIAITAIEALELESRKQDVKILATDICTNVLQKALEGVYPAKQLESVPPDIMKRYFSRVVGTLDIFSVNPVLKKYLTFKRLNLSSFPYPLSGPLDIIFCRNVMIYFDRELRQAISNEFAKLLRPGGYLFLSRSENLLGINHSYKTVATSVYQKAE